MTYKTFKIDTDRDGVVQVAWAAQRHLETILDETTTAELEQIVKQTSADTSVSGVVLKLGSEAPAAGPDLSMLERLRITYVQWVESKGEMAAKKLLFDRCRRYSLLFRSIEISGKPWAAAIKGNVLGAAFELTLCCHYRVAANDANIRLGLPEIKNGLFPGAGGTQRVPRIVSLQDAVPILLKGETINVERAKDLNLIHSTVLPTDLIKTAKSWIKKGGKPIAPWDEKGFTLPSGPVFSKAGMTTFPVCNAFYRRDTYDNYPAARSVLSCLYEGLQLPIDAALRMESRHFVRILRSSEVEASIRSLFLSKQELNKGKHRPNCVPSRKVRRIAVVGAGFVGASVGYVSARSGIEVILINRSQESANRAKANAKSIMDDLIRKGRATESDRDATLSRITATTDYAATKDCDLVIESVFEERDTKYQVYAKLRPFLSKSSIVASNTSTLPINSLAEQFEDKERFIGVHFFSPVDKMMLVEIILGRRSSDIAVATAFDFVRQLGKTPIVLNDSRGFFANRCVSRYICEGVQMFLEGVPAAMIENCAKLAGMPVGPLSLSDETALDLRLKIIKAAEADLGATAVDQADKKLMVELVENRSRFGRKNSKGFYDYPERGKGGKSLWPGLTELQTERLNPDTVDSNEIKRRFLVVQSVEAARTVEEQVVTDPAEADVGSILGFGFAPFTGGVLSYIDLIGAKKFIGICQSFEDRYGDRFAPPRLLQEMAKNGDRFYEGHRRPSHAALVR